MPIVNNCEEVRNIYQQAAGRHWVIPCFCSENLTTTEAILTAAQEFAIENGYKKIPVSIAITVKYSHRAQAENYTHSHKWDIGLKLFCSDVEILTSIDGPFPNVDVLFHLDHIQHDNDAELLKWDLSKFSSIMYDASTLPFNMNISKTAEFVKNNKSTILIEGACDEIFDASGGMHNQLTTPEKAKKYYEETGVDMLVANLGTEHRATEQVLHYYGDIAQKIKECIGNRIVLHGLSSVSLEQVKHLFEDGICKVNIWTMLERDSSAVLLKEMIINKEQIAGKSANISHFTTLYRQEIIFLEMKKIIRSFFDMWYV